MPAQESLSERLKALRMQGQQALPGPSAPTVQQPALRTPPVSNTQVGPHFQNAAREMRPADVQSVRNVGEDLVQRRGGDMVRGANTNTMRNVTNSAKYKLKPSMLRNLASSATKGFIVGSLLQPNEAGDATLQGAAQRRIEAGEDPNQVYASLGMDDGVAKFGEYGDSLADLPTEYQQDASQLRQPQAGQGEMSNEEYLKSLLLRNVSQEEAARIDADLARKQQAQQQEIQASKPWLADASNALSSGVDNFLGTTMRALTPEEELGYVPPTMGDVAASAGIRNPQGEVFGGGREAIMEQRSQETDQEPTSLRNAMPSDLEGATTVGQGYEATYQTPDGFVGVKADGTKEQITEEQMKAHTQMLQEQFRQGAGIQTQRMDGGVATFEQGTGNLRDPQGPTNAQYLESQGIQRGTEKFNEIMSGNQGQQAGQRGQQTQQQPTPQENIVKAIAESPSGKLDARQMREAREFIASRPDLDVDPELGYVQKGQTVKDFEDILMGQKGMDRKAAKAMAKQQAVHAQQATQRGNVDPYKQQMMAEVQQRMGFADHKFLNSMETHQLDAMKKMQEIQNYPFEQQQEAIGTLSKLVTSPQFYELPKNDQKLFRKMLANSIKKMAGMDADEVDAGGEEGEGELPKPTSEEEFNSLPKGSLYIDPEDGKTYRKE